MKVKTRFAPSPTGYLHVGGVRTALFAWLVAKHAGGQFVLRIEDTDRSRHVEESEQHIIESLKWLGLEADEEPERQSERLDIYKAWAQKLIDNGRAYADATSEAELDKLRQAAKDAKRPFLFREHRPETKTEWKEGVSLRFKSEPQTYSWHDEVLGDLSTGPEAVDDFIILKSDGFPTYNFAHIIDDHEMGITHVIRSQEFLPSMPKFLNLYEALGIDFPVFATLPYVLGPDGKKKLSKRDGAKDILDYRREGFLPQALVSFLATLGWNDGTEQEIFTIEELVEKFELKRVQRSGAKFDDQRLLWVNGHFIRQTPLDELCAQSEPFWPDSAKAANPEHKKKVLAIVQERLKYLAELPNLTVFFFEEPDEDQLKELFTNPSDKQLKKLDKPEVLEMLKAAKTELGGSDFSAADLEKRLNGLLEKLGTKPGILFAAIRIAVTGSKSSPQLFDTLGVLGKQTSLQRLELACALLEA
jgi:glutamyl-tRNA synthetase